MLLAEANRIIEDTTAKARELGVEISVTVCDADSRLVALNRMDGALATSNRGSIGRAVAAASGHPSGDAETFVDFSLRTRTVIGEGPPVIRRRGDLPVIRAGAIDGACGVSGANNNERRRSLCSRGSGNDHRRAKLPTD